MKLRYIIIIGIVCLVVTTTLTIATPFTLSQEMRTLITIEKTLDIPQPDRRSVDDRGCYKDWKNAQQYDRQIYYSYGHEKHLPMAFVETLVAHEQWEIAVLSFDTSELENQEESYLYRWTESDNLSLNEFISKYNLMPDGKTGSLLRDSRIPLDHISFKNVSGNACISISPPIGRNFKNSDPDNIFLDDCLGREVCR